MKLIKPILFLLLLFSCAPEKDPEPTVHRLIISHKNADIYLFKGKDNTKWIKRSNGDKYSYSIEDENLSVECFQNPLKAEYAKDSLSTAQPLHIANRRFTSKSGYFKIYY